MVDKKVIDYVLNVYNKTKFFPQNLILSNLQALSEPIYVFILITGRAGCIMFSQASKIKIF